LARIWYIFGPLTKVHRKAPYGALPELIMEFKPKFAKIGGHFEGGSNKIPSSEIASFRPSATGGPVLLLCKV